MVKTPAEIKATLAMMVKMRARRDRFCHPLVKVRLRLAEMAEYVPIRRRFLPCPGKEIEGSFIAMQ